jgi:CubicO group peptidase (beta-lactamase class C family)
VETHEKWVPSTTAAMGAALDRMVAARQTPGGVVAAGTVGGSVTEYAATGTTGVGGSVASGPTTFYDVASLTKVVATWPLVGRAVAHGLLDLEAPVSDHIRTAIPGPGAAVTVRQILTHTSGLMPATRLDRYTGDSRDLAEMILSEPLDTPGEHRYINRGFILLGLLLARVHGKSLRALVDDLGGGLGSSGLRYGPFLADDRVAPTERRLVGGCPLHGVVHDENAAALGGVAGHAGVFAHAQGLAELAHHFLSARQGRGALKDIGAYVGESWKPAVRVDAANSRGLAWLITDTGLVHHRGFTGTGMYLDPATGRYLVVLTNAIAYGRERHGLAELHALALAQFDD